MKTQKVEEEALELTPAQVTELKVDLLRQRDALLERHRRQVREVPAVPSDVQDDGDEAAWTEGQHRIGHLAQLDDARLARIDAALMRIEQGTYGLDEVTEEPIGYRRLKAIPWATRTVVQEEQSERRRAA